ncbi:hypothetical protein [Allomesorhizobium camelthorni]|uniref:Uncharacterized protein n=1 Tax=Allomesorhizobium camelthorni TaxID=475069 RepID=A0A6G4WAI3_9HYPH|nr:hypothetical protein [Mesorhizobium camelthorni]NGO51609.1 hypothetical protein [Mesorhizobium camelthorni]
MVIAAVTYFFWGEYRAYEAQQAAEQARVRQIVRDTTVGRASELARSGTCTALATRLVDTSGHISKGDRLDARTCAIHADLGAYERNTFDRFKAQIAE